MNCVFPDIDHWRGKQIVETSCLYGVFIENFRRKVAAAKLL